jgi:hypothetical protein
MRVLTFKQAHRHFSGAQKWWKGFTRIKSCIIGGSGEKRLDAFCRGSGGTPPEQFPEIVSLTQFIFKL